MILTDNQIKEAIRVGDIKISPYEDGQVQSATYDLRVGPQGATTSSKKLVDIKAEGVLVLKPGDFGIVTALEEITLGPDYVARFGLRSKFARKGLIATTGPQIDPGFSGRLIIGLTNLTPRPVSIPYKDDFLTIEIHKLSERPEKFYNGPYQNITELRPEDIEMIIENEGMALSEVVTTLQSLSKNVGDLNSNVIVFEKSMIGFEKSMSQMQFISNLMLALIGIGLTAISIIYALK